MTMFNLVYTIKWKLSKQHICLIEQDINQHSVNPVMQPQTLLPIAYLPFDVKEGTIKLSLFLRTVRVTSK